MEQNLFILFFGYLGHSHYSFKIMVIHLTNCFKSLIFNIFFADIPNLLISIKDLKNSKRHKKN